MAGPLDYRNPDDGEDENTPTRPRVPRPGEVVQGTPGDPNVMQAHGTQGWDATGHDDPYKYRDPFAGIKQPDLPSLEERPRQTVPQVGRAGSILGAITGAVGGAQQLKQRDWDTRYGAKIGGYEREVGLAKERGAAESRHLMSSRIPGTAGGPLVQQNEDGTFSTIVQTPGGGRAPVANALPASSFNAQTNSGQRERTGLHHDETALTKEGMRGETARDVAKTAADSRIKAAQSHANNTNRPVLMTDPDSGESYWIMPNASQAPGTVEPTGAPSGLVKPSPAPRPDTVTSTVEQHNRDGTLASRKTARRTVKPPAAASATYNSADAVIAAHKAGKISDADAKAQLQKFGWK